MRLATALGLLALAVVGGYLAVAEQGALATSYAIGVTGLVGVVTIRLLLAWSPAPDAVAPLMRLAPARRPSAAPRPAALLEWEAALLTARVHGSDDALRRRLEPVIEARLRDRRGIGATDPRSVDLLGPTWGRLLHAERAAAGASTTLDELDELTRRLEAR